ncbi:MAG: NPCBM/NEW2 domain-containing protein [Bacteroidia bacterium]|nr:NPCBM/NEW2 domain-containing protein [Bacteroidia bacterium]
MKQAIRLLIVFFYIVSGGCTPKTTNIWLDDLKIQTFSEGIPSVSAKKSAGGDSIRLAGHYFERGIGVQSVSVLSFLLNGKAEQFSAMVGADDKGNKNMLVQFYVLGDQKVLFESGAMKVGDAPKKVSANLSGIQRLGLLVTVSLEDEGYGRTYSDWADAKLVMLDENAPQPIPNNGEKYILTPPPAKTPKINSARIFGATPGNPFLYTIATTGDRPVEFSSENLPKGLVLDSKTGLITGKVTKKGTYLATLKAKNVFGESVKPLKIVIGDTIALTPPIGWNGWNSWARNIDGEKVIASANAMVSMGLSNHGWTYINIDDTWEGQRGGKLNALQANEKFPEFKKMIDNIHAMGLKLGIYSTPWISTYAGYAGKYDWRIELNSAERMSDALKKSGRDILFSLSNSAPFENAKDWARVSNAWRTGPDIRDSWLSLYTSAFTIDKWAPFGGPGHWNDPDMLILGNVTTGTELHPTRLTPDEQYSHFSLFSLLAAPLLIGCPIEQLDDFSLNLLTNDEVIEVNQDPLGKPARFVADQNGVQFWAKPMEDGSFAVGLFNTDDFGKTPQSYFRWGSEQPKQFVFDFAKVGLKGKWKIRDLWRQKDLGEFDGSFETTINHHGVVLISMIKI